MSKKEQQLEEYRKQIDAIDSQMLHLLGNRVEIVQKVGELKGLAGTGKTIIRPGREAKMIRKIIDISDIDFPKAALAQIWRMIIAGAINIEEDSCVAVYDPSNSRECFWLAREYFGAFTQMHRHNSVETTINDLTENNATVAVVPLWDNGLHDPWWVRMNEIDPNVKIFARLPFLRMSDSRLVPIVAIANVVPEESGDDISVWMFKLKKGSNIDIIEPLITKAGLKNYLQAVSHGEKYDYYLMEFDGFITNDNAETIDDIQASHDKIFAAEYLGSYARPIEFKE